MSIISNPWVGYLERSYLSIKNAVLPKIAISNPEMTDHTESNPLILFVSIFAGISEQLNWYIDQTARESFMSTARRRSSVIKHSYLLDYRIKARNSESVNLTLSVFDSMGDPVNLSADVTIPVNMVFTSEAGIPFITTQGYVLTAGSQTYVIPVAQRTLQEDVLLGTTDGTPSQRVQLPANYQNNSIELRIDGNAYDRQETWAFSESTDTHYIVEVKPDNSIVVELGDGVNGILPDSGLEIRADMYTTLGPDGRVQANQIIQTPALSLPADTVIEVTNLTASSGGAPIETSERIRRNAIYQRRHNYRMVSRKDYLDLISAQPGVAQCDMRFCCGASGDIFIAPTGGGVASGELIEEIEELIEEYGMVGVRTQVYNAGETVLFIQLTATVKKGRNLALAKTDVENALLAFGSDLVSTINRRIRMSEITTTVDNLERIEYSEINVMYAIPYARPYSHNVELDWVREINPGSVGISEWSLQYIGSGVRVIRDRILLGVINLDEEYSDDIITFTINTGAYTSGQRWTFKTYPYTRNILLDDFTIPRTNIGNLEIITREDQPNVIC